MQDEELIERLRALYDQTQSRRVDLEYAAADRLEALAQPVVGVEGLRQVVTAAYEQGAQDVHRHWVENPGEAPRGDPEFSEAANDYSAALAASPSPVPSEDLKVLLPPGTVEKEYLEGWCDGQTYLIGNLKGWGNVQPEDLVPSPSPVVGDREAIGRELILAVEDFINEPPRLYAIEPMEVRDYRHSLYRVWTPLRDAILSLSTPVVGGN